MGIRQGTPCPPELARRPANLPTSPPPPRVKSQTGIWVRIYRDGNKPIDIGGFATIEQATAAGNEWQSRLWWRVTIDGRTVAEEPMRSKR